MISNSKTALKLKSSSKINLGLWIKEKRDDDYHNIETIFFENNNLQDEIEIEYQENNITDINVIFEQSALNNTIPKEKNLAYQAAKLYLEKVGKKGTCNLKINKNIPLQAGLGGGSSNAAFVLKGLNQLFGNILKENELLDLALKIGSDVSFFVIGGICLGSGRGEILKSLNNKVDLSVKIVKIDSVSISTKWAYEQIDSREFMTDHRNEIDNLIVALNTGDKDLLFKNIFNDFEMAVFSYFPQLIKERNKLLDEGYKVSGLCGSGSAIFGIK